MKIIHRDIKGRNRFIVVISNVVEIIACENTTEQNKKYFSMIRGGEREYYELHQVIGGFVSTKYESQILPVLSQFSCVSIGKYNDRLFWWAGKENKAAIEAAVSNIKPRIPTGWASGFSKFWDCNTEKRERKNIVFPHSRLV